MKVVLAADGGGSKTHVARVRADGALLGFARGPRSHEDHLGVEGSLDVLEELVAQSGGSADVAVILLAGIDFPEEEEVYRAAAVRRGLAPEAIVGNDTFAILRAGTERGFGIAITCGHGINCVGVTQDGVQVRFPSLGDISGDWGGGHDVGRAALFAAARSQDGRGPRTSLEQLVPAHFGFATPLELGRAVHEKRLPERSLAELTPLVFAEADVDETAGAIVDRLADEIVAFVRASLARADFGTAPVEVALGGSLLQSGNAHLYAAIDAGVGELSTPVVLRRATSPPIVGAALVGLDVLGAGPEAKRRLREELAAAL